MGVVESVLDAAQRRIDGLWPELNERQRRRLLGVEARELGWGGVSALARADGYRLQANAKVREGRQHPDRDGQFRHIDAVVRRFLRSGDPVVSVDAKKKELVGADPGYKNGGREWEPTGEPTRVGVHDFPDPAVGKAVPYGVYDLAADTGWVSVGCDGDTAAFAVATLRRWWSSVGSG